MRENVGAPQLGWSDAHRRGAAENVVFSRKSRAPDHYWEIIYPGEDFSWREDGSVTERHRRQKRKRIWATCLGLALALLVLGNAFAVSWLFSAAASVETTSVDRK